MPLCGVLFVLYGGSILMSVCNFECRGIVVFQDTLMLSEKSNYCFMHRLLKLLQVTS